MTAASTKAAVEQMGAKSKRMAQTLAQNPGAPDQDFAILYQNLMWYYILYRRVL